MVIDKVETQVLHKLAEAHPAMLEENYKALRLDIEQKGQLEPVIRYRSKIVDGRHRLQALKDLGIEVIKCNDLPRNISLDEVKDIVISSEIRRHETPTQLAVKAYYYSKEHKGFTQKKAAEKFGVDLKRVSELSSIVKAGREDIVRMLGSGKSVVIENNYATSSIQMLYRQVKSLEVRQRDDALGELFTKLNNINVELTEDQLTKIEDLATTISDSFKDESKAFKETLAKRIYKGLVDEK